MALEPTAMFLSILLASRTQAHIYHLQTASYAQHIALEEYYNEIVDLIDDYAEVCQGLHGLIIGYKVPQEYIEDGNPIKYFTEIRDFLSRIDDVLDDEDELVSIRDDIKTLVSKTLYKLSNLS